VEDAIGATDRPYALGVPSREQVVRHPDVGAVAHQQPRVLVAEVQSGHVEVLHGGQDHLARVKGHGGVLHVDVGVVVDRPTVNGVVR